MATERIAWVDIARIIAIILIVGFHVAYEFTLDPALRQIGFFGASLFFIASGYMLSAKYPELVQIDIRWLKKRWLRIASLYYPALICISLLFMNQGIYARSRDLVLHFLFLNWTSHDVAYSIISPAWFLVPLIGLYILFPFLNRAMKKSAWFLLAAFLLTIAFRFLLPGSWTDFSPLFFLGEFCFGITIAYGERRWQVLGLAVLTALINPLMVVPFALFLLLGWLGKGITELPGIMNALAANTFEIFLFHEAAIMIALGKWSVFGQGIGVSLAILGVAIAVIKVLSRRFNAYISG